MKRPRHRPSRGAALLVAMVLLTVVATLASGMVWQQWKAVQVESAERSRAQSGWILQGALDWARLILREDARSGRATSLSEPWATPLAEARLSTFLATDRDHNADEGPEAFLAGSITDAQSRYNLRNLLLDGKLVPAQQAMLQRLCTSAGLPSETAALLADGLLAASLAADSNAPLPPQQLAVARSPPIHAPATTAYQNTQHLPKKAARWARRRRAGTNVRDAITRACASCEVASSFES